MVLFFELMLDVFRAGGLKRCARLVFKRWNEKGFGQLYTDFTLFSMLSEQSKVLGTCSTGLELRYGATSRVIILIPYANRPKWRAEIVLKSRKNAAWK